MKKYLLLLVYVMASFICLSQSGYYYDGNFISFEAQDSTKCYVIVNESNVDSFEKQNRGKYVKIRDTEYMIEKSNLMNNDLITYVSNIYSTNNSEFIVILPTITICLINKDTLFLDLLKQYRVFVTYNDGRKIRIRCESETSQEILQILSHIQKLDNILWCEPEMLSNYKSTNTLYPRQYYLKNTGQNGGSVGIDINVEPAWNLSHGSHVVVAVIDEGVDRNHEDLQDRVIEGYTASFPNCLGAPQAYSSTPSSCKGHGVACAGIIAATNNSIGIRGIADSSIILPVNIVPYPVVEPYYYGFGTSVEIAEAINWAWKRSDILSCSWASMSSNEVRDAIDSALLYGREGKGTVVVAASGNNFPLEQNVSFPSIINGVITVGAIKNNGDIWEYSQRGAAMDLVAPSGNVNYNGDIVTTDRMGSLGYNTNIDGNYADIFGGTSAACPQVAGLIALMLSANPSLTVQQVANILHSTARDLGSVGFDYTYGYGLVDAHLAVVNAMEYGHVASIMGSNTLADCEANVYQCDFLHPEIFTYSWSASPNLNIIENLGASVRVMPVSLGIGTLSVNVYQQGRLMYTLTKNVQVTSVLSGITPISTTPFNISSNTTWSTETYLPVTATIDPNVTLTITGNLLCGEGGRILVQPGGKLVVDGSILTSACGGVMWQGIEVVGDRTKRQVEPYQGKLELKNGAILENAMCGIYTGLHSDTVNYATTGGIISAKNTTFKNNRQSVVINSYAYTAPSGSIANYNATFSRCTFTVDNNNLFAANNTGFAEHARLWDVKGVKFEGCTFSKFTNNLYGNGRGIYADDAGVYVGTYCPRPLYYTECECPESIAVYSSFSGFTTAVEVNTTGNPYSVRIDETSFNNNGTGVRINGNDYATVTRNTFNLDSWPSHSGGNVGLYLNTCTGYLVDDNVFERTTYPSGQLILDNSTGICVAGSGISPNSIHYNHFNNLTKGISVVGTNGHHKWSGLQMTCNDFSGGKHDIYLNNGATVSYVQGSSTKGADNMFSNVTYNTTNFHNPNAVPPISYYYSNSYSNLDPAHYSNLTKTSIKEEYDCSSTLCDNGIPGGGGGGGQYLAGFQSDMNAYTTASANQSPADGTDGGVDETLLETVRALSETYYNAVRCLLADTVLDLNDLEQWHTVAQPIADPYSLTETRFMEGYAEPFVAEADDAELANYAEFHAMKLALRGQYDNTDNQDNNNINLSNSQNSPTINWYALTPAQIAQLQTIAERNTGRASVMAKGVLCFFFGICYDDDLLVDDNQDNKGNQGDAETRSAKAVQQDEGTNLTVYPNPTDDVLYVELSGGGIKSVGLYDLQGRVVTGVCDTPQQGNVAINVRSVPAGVYLLRVTDTEGREYHQKIVKK